MRKYLPCLCFFVLALYLVSAEESVLLSKLVPKIEQPNYYLTAEGNNYALFLSVPDGGSRSETVKFKIDPESGVKALLVDGLLTLQFKDRDAYADLQYTAGPKGYYVKYKYTAGLPKVSANVPFLRQSTLKGITG